MYAKVESHMIRTLLKTSHPINADAIPTNRAKIYAQFVNLLIIII